MVSLINDGLLRCVVSSWLCGMARVDRLCIGPMANIDP